MRRVVVTGLGIVCATGRSVEEFRASLCEGRSGTARISSYDPSWFHTQVGAEVRDFSFDSYVPPVEQRQIDRQSLLAIAAADEAVADAGFESRGEEHRCGVFMGTGMGPSAAHEHALTEVAVHRRKPRPTTVPKCMFNAAAALLSMRYVCRGPSQVIVTACAASAHAIGQAASYIRHGVVDSCLAGGSEAFPSYSLMGAWDTLRVMSRDNDHAEQACRPFAKNRSGFVMGEGAAVLVLEAEDRARKRGARIYGEVAGVGLSSDAHHITQPRLEGIAASISNALADARVAPEDVEYVNAHGTATSTNDAVETRALHSVFGSHAKRLLVSSTKSGHGHTVGAAGAIEATATLLGLLHGFVPPTLNLDVPDPDCDLDYVPHEAREKQFDIALSNSFAFGGHNVVLVLRRYQA